MIRKGDTKDANDTERDDKTSQEKRVWGNQSKWFSCKTQESDDRDNSYCSLSLQSHEKGAGAGDIKTSGA